GGNKATLILADGRQLSLSESNEAIIVEGKRIRYDDGTTLVSSEISQSDASIEKKSSIARIVTPIGGSYAIVLSDGSKVWLNAHSRLDYPVEFDENERVVEVVGE